jgi:CubicO group peptidase (beta-lactamase class C family)
VDAAALLDALDARVPETLERFGVPGLAVGVLANGTSAEQAYGVANLETGELLHPNARFRIASITKSFVAMLAMTLVEEGTLGLDERVQGLRLPWPRITLRQLLSHQAGLAAEWPVPLGEYGNGDDALELLAEDSPLAGVVGPGELFAYCNAGYWLAGALVAKSTGKTFEEAMRRRVLEPLGLERTGFEQDGVVPRHLTDPESGEARVAAPLSYSRARRPSGGLCSCVGDLLRFAVHLLGGPGPLSLDAANELQRPQAWLAEGAYGLGLGVLRVRGRTTVEHGGSIPGYRSLLLLLPDEESAIVLLTNSDRGGAALEYVLDGLGLGVRLPPEQEATQRELSALAGLYREPSGIEIAVAVADGGIDAALVQTDPFDGHRHEYPLVHARPAGRELLVVREGDERGAFAEFLRDASLLRFGWLCERVVE